jgi:Holliday junction resolvase
MARRVDSIQRQITESLRKLGITVLVLSNLGHGCPDLLLGHLGKNYLIELKCGKNELTSFEKRFFEEWKGQADIAHNLDEILQLLGLT